MTALEAFASQQLKAEVPQFCVGDTVKVHQRIVEGSRERTQIFEGTVIARKNGGISETFTVRRLSFGVGTEKTFPLPRTFRRWKLSGPVRFAGLSFTTCVTEWARVQR